MTVPLTPSSTVAWRESPWPISVDRYHRMIAAGVLTADDRLELLFGHLIAKLPTTPQHAIATAELQNHLAALTEDRFHVRAQQPLTTADSEPEPDVFIVRGKLRDYLSRHPYPHEAPLVVEVADATLTRDQNTKKTLYARAEIAVYWIVNLVHEQVEVYERPSADMYAELRTYRAGDRVPVRVDGHVIGHIAVASILP